MDSKRRRVFQIVGLTAAVCFALYGVARDEVGIILNKAVNICFECIGLG